MSESFIGEPPPCGVCVCVCVCGGGDELEAGAGAVLRPPASSESQEPCQR